MKLKEWGIFTLLGLIWGSSFLWIKIAVADVHPFVLVTFRVLFGLIGLLIVMRWQRQSLPRDRRTILAFIFMGIFNTAIPFVLISWGANSPAKAPASSPWSLRPVPPSPKEPSPTITATPPS